MLRRFRTWIRVVLPLDLTAATFVGVLLLYHALAFIGPKLYYSALWVDIAAPVRFVVAALAIAYAIFRVAYFNPIENRKYGEWLVNSVWDSSQPLPLGPLDLVWQDVVIVAILTVLFPAGYISRLIVPTAFLLVYCVGCAISQSLRAGVYWSSYGLAFLIGCSILAIFSPWGRLAAAAAMYAVCYLERQWLLGKLPFTNAGHERLDMEPMMDDPTTTAGWPAPPVERERRSWKISHLHAALAGLAIAWLLFCVLYHFPEEPPLYEMMPVFGQFVLWTVVCRIWLYANGYAPPISLLGRMATRRFIIPGYDVVFLSPLTAAAISLGFAWAATSIGVSSFVAISIASGLMTWLSLAMPPRREDWHFTGHHRIAFRFRAAQVERGQSKSAGREIAQGPKVVSGRRS